MSLQENNALAVLDVAAGTITELLPLGFKDHSVAGGGLDPSDRDSGVNGGVNITPWPVLGMYQPDAIAAYEVNGETLLVSANEGDARDYEAFSEEARLGDEVYALDEAAFPDAADLKGEAQLGRLTVTTATGDTDGDGAFEEVRAFGGRSFAIWNASGALVFDSGDAFERLTAAAYPEFFNANNDENGPETFDSRSDNKGPEPEAVALGELDGRTYAFIGLERVGGVVTYDVSDPAAPVFVDYTNHRDFEAEVASEAAGDLGAEGLLFIPAAESPSGAPLLVVANEVSGLTTLFEVAVAD